MASYKTPGVYILDNSNFPPSVSQVETAIPAFIGYTEKAVNKEKDSLSLVPTRIKSLLEFEEYFGLALNEDSITVTINDKEVNGSLEREYSVNNPSVKPFLMYYCLQMYFANGGGPCYIVSVAQYGTTTTTPATFVSKTDLDQGLININKETEPTLLLFPDATNLDDADDFYGLYNDALKQCNDLKDRFTIIDTKTDDELHGTPIADLRDKITNDRNCLKYGAAYYPFLETNLNYQYAESEVIIKHYLKMGHSEKKNGTFDGLKLDAVIGINTARSNEIKEKIALLPMTLPPSSTIAGIYARVDNNRGVWKAPANVSLNNVIKPSVDISGNDQESLNIDVIAGKSINAIRSFIGKGVLVWGARTLTGNDNEWRYISVRRFFNMAEESIKKALDQFVFDPNDRNTWVSVRAMIEHFLTNLWRAGALAGAKIDDAFFVRVGLGESMTAQDVLEGNMIIDIGMAAVRPAEFIILRVSQKMQEA